MSSQTIYNDVDKALLAKLSTLQATGIYSAAYRIVDMSYVPMRSLISVTYPDMLRAGEGGLRPVLGVVRKRLALPAAAYCVAGTVAMIAAAGLVPLVLGDTFESSIPALRALSVLLIFKGLHFVAADTLTSANQQGARTVVQIGIAVLNVVLCLAIIPDYGWQGAVAVSLICDGLLALALWGIIGWRVRGLAREDAALTQHVVDGLPQGGRASIN
jgi:O-antigen/teichoic acid export membrane protein